jgi:hypothetical protein
VCSGAPLLAASSGAPLLAASSSTVSVRERVGFIEIVSSFHTAEDGRNKTK